MKIKINVLITNISAERFRETGSPLPPVKITTNLNLIKIEKSAENSLDIPFVFTINYNPTVAQISVKGKAYVSGEKEEIKKIFNEHKKKKPPPIMIIQTISNVVFLESILISKTLSIPPPIPLPPIPFKHGDKRRSEPSYRA